MFNDQIPMQAGVLHPAVLWYASNGKRRTVSVRPLDPSNSFLYRRTVVLPYNLYPLFLINSSASSARPRQGPGFSCLSVVTAAAHRQASSGEAPATRLPT